MDPTLLALTDIQIDRMLDIGERIAIAVSTLATLALLYFQRRNRTTTQAEIKKVHTEATATRAEATAARVESKEALEHANNFSDKISKLSESVAKTAEIAATVPKVVVEVKAPEATAISHNGNDPA